MNLHRGIAMHINAISLFQKMTKVALKDHVNEYIYTLKRAYYVTKFT